MKVSVKEFKKEYKKINIDNIEVSAVFTVSLADFHSYKYLVSLKHCC